MSFKAPSGNNSPSIEHCWTSQQWHPLAVRLTLLAMEQRTDGMVWLRYRCS